LAEVIDEFLAIRMSTAASSRPQLRNWAAAGLALLLLRGLPSAAAASEAPAVGPEQPTIECGRLSALRNALSSGVTGAAPQFWAAIEAAGTPIVESTETHPGEARVTFLWRGAAGTKSVRLISGPQIVDRFKNLGFRRLDGTDVWFLTLHVPWGWRVGYKLVENAEQHGYPGGWAWMAAAISDPRNRFHSEPGAATAESYSIFETPEAPPEPWLHRHPGVAAGAVTSRRLASALLGAEQTVDVYVPSGYGVAGGRPAGTVYLIDGGDYLRDMRVADVFDNLIGEHHIAPLVAVMVHNLPGAARNRELSCDPSFTEFLAAELVPWVRRNYLVSTDPSRTIVGGYSLGGLEAAYAASVHPDIFGAVLSESGSFWWRPGSPGAANPSQPWMATQFAAPGARRVRFFLSVGRYEPGLQGGLITNQLMRDALLTRGYEIKYEEVEGQHDPINWRLAFPDGLMFLASRE
jgi:enterochelin esterase family protein